MPQTTSRRRHTPNRASSLRHARVPAEYQIVAQQLDALKNARCQLLFACTHCDACTQSIAFVLVRIVCPARRGKHRTDRAEVVMQASLSLAGIPQSPATTWLCTASYRRRWFSKSLTGHHNIFEPKNSPTSWLGSNPVCASSSLPPTHVEVARPAG